ncbi:MAG: Yip1 family protein [Bacteroidota bacterium]
MIECTVCGEQNDDLAVTCKSCKGYLQTKVENLDLFSTMWGLLESPKRTFKRIVLSRRKNYVFFLSALVGVWALFTVFWGLNLGARFDNTFTLLATGSLAGLGVGVVGVLIDAVLLSVLVRFLGGKATLRNLFAVVSYASVPVIFTLIFVYPIKIAIFGQYLFDQNPSPMIINPGLYVALLAFDVAAVIWSISLVVKGVSVGAGLTQKKSVILGTILLLVVSTAIIGLQLLGP